MFIKPKLFPDSDFVVYSNLTDIVTNEILENILGQSDSEIIIYAIDSQPLG